jgi:hypothetical protein
MLTMMYQTLPSKRKWKPSSVSISNSSHSTKTKTKTTALKDSSSSVVGSTDRDGPRDTISSKPPSMRELLKLPIIRSLCISGSALTFVHTAFDCVFVLFCYTPINTGGLAFTVSFFFPSFFCGVTGLMIVLKTNTESNRNSPPRSGTVSPSPGLSPSGSRSSSCLYSSADSPPHGYTSSA